MQNSGMHAAAGSTAPLTWDRWLCKIEELWKNQAKEEIVRVLAKAFCSVEPRDLHAFILHLLDKSQDLRRMKPSSIGLVVLREFSQWVNKYSHLLPKDLSGVITDGMKLHALRLATSGHINLFDLICQLYHLQSDGNEFLATHLRVLIARKQFKEAGVAAYKLRLQHCFKIEEICLPLVFQDKVNLVEKYIQENKATQIELIQRLDSFCAKNSDLVDVIDQMNVPGTRKEKLRPKYLSKLIIRLTKLYKLDPAICPNTTFHRDLGAVRFLLYKKYIEQTLDAENWDELVVNTIRDNKALQEEFINQLLEYRDPSAAAKWAMHFQIDRSKLAEDVLGEIEKYQACPPSDEPDSWDDDVLTPPVPFYQLNLPLERVVMVDSLELLEVCERHIVQADQTVGIDMEWTPSFTATQITRVAVVQLATKDWAYLLDLPTLMAIHADWTTIFFDNFFSSTQVLKLGFGISSDFQMLTKSYPNLKGPVAKIQRMVDLFVLSKQILSAKPDLLKREQPAEEDGSSPVKGLSELTQMCFGQALDKKEQLSDWEKRPLRPSQVQYAALDAFCLLEIYSFLKIKVTDAWLDIDMEPTYCSKTPKKPKSKTKESKKPKNKAASHGFKNALHDSSQPLRPGDLAVVCDTMLQGLGRQLRACGVDVKILETTDEHDEAAKIAVRECRMILTAGTPYQTLKSQVGEGRCMAVDTKCNARQQAIQVLEDFNVRVRQGDVFSRCHICNSNVYVHVNNKDMRRLWQNKKALLKALEGTAAEISAASGDAATTIPTATSGYQSSSSQDPLYQRTTTNEPVQSKPTLAVADSSVSAKYLTRPIHEYDSDDGDGGLCLDFEDFDFDSGDYYHVAQPAIEVNPPGATPVSGATNVRGDSSELSDWNLQGPQIANSADVQNVAQPTHSSNSQIHSSEISGTLADSPSCKRGSPFYNPPTDAGLEETVDFEKVTVGSDVPLQVELIPEGILDKVQNFFCCSRCGKAFWEGTHFDRVVTQFSHVLDMSAEPKV